MSDRYAQIIRTRAGRLVSGQVGLPVPVPLDRYSPGDPVVEGPVLIGAAPGGSLASRAAQVLAGAGAEVLSPLDPDIRRILADAAIDAGVWNSRAAGSGDSFKAVVFDASGIATIEGLHEAYAFFHATIRRVRTSGRVIVLARPPADASDPVAAVAQRALEGLTRSIGKEVRRGATANLLEVTHEGETGLASTLRFFLSPKSAYVSGQVVRIGASPGGPRDSAWERPQEGRVALVTGASRGIGEAIAEVLARDGAHVVGVDVPAAEPALAAAAERLGGSYLPLDITSPEAPARLAEHLRGEHGGVDVVVHNAGITRDRTLGRMPAESWDAVLGVNLLAPHRIDAELFSTGTMREGGSVVCVSSISGIAGNAGQTNYATSKAGIIGLVEAYAPLAAPRGCTLNAVAPGFIETQMTAAMPIGTREAGRRMNSLAQGGLPGDVAETVGWLADPGSGSVNGNVVRVCGQSLLGA